MSDKPCPFCGSTNLGVRGDDKIVAVCCENCQATGPNHYIGEMEWNMRATQLFSDHIAVPVSMLAELTSDAMHRKTITGDHTPAAKDALTILAAHDKEKAKALPSPSVQEGE